MKGDEKLNEFKRERLILVIVATYGDEVSKGSGGRVSCSAVVMWTEYPVVVVRC